MVELGQLITSDINQGFVDRYAEVIAKAVEGKGQMLDNCIGFIDGTFIGVKRLGDYAEQESLYRG